MVSSSSRFVDQPHHSFACMSSPPINSSSFFPPWGHSVLCIWCALWRKARAENRGTIIPQFRQRKHCEDPTGKNTVDLERRGNVLNCTNRIQWVGYKYSRKWRIANDAMVLMWVTGEMRMLQRQNMQRMLESSSRSYCMVTIQQSPVAESADPRIRLLGWPCQLSPVLAMWLQMSHLSNL